MPRTTLARPLTATIALVAVAVIIALGAMWDVQVAVLALAGLAFVGAALRLWLPAGVSFSVRRRAVDVATALVFAGVLAYLGLTTPLA